MENFDWTSFTRKILIKATLADLYNAWTKATEIEKWFLKEAAFYDQEGDRIAPEKTVKAGDNYKWTWHLYEEVEKGQIIEANGKDFLEFTFAGECRVTIKLTEENNYVRVELTHKDIPTDENSKQYIRLGCHSGWSFYLLNLKSVYEGGLDLRNKDTSTTPMLNN